MPSTHEIQIIAETQQRLQVTIRQEPPYADRGCVFRISDDSGKILEERFLVTNETYTYDDTLGNTVRIRCAYTSQAYYLDMQ